MKLLFLSACFAAISLAQQSSALSGRWDGRWNVNSDQMSGEGQLYHLRGHAEMRGAGMVFRADTIDYDEARNAIHLAGHVRIETKDRGVLQADEADYDVNSGDARLKLTLAPAK